MKRPTDIAGNNRHWVVRPLQAPLQCPYQAQLTPGRDETRREERFAQIWGGGMRATRFLS